MRYARSVTKTTKSKPRDATKTVRIHNEPGESLLVYARHVSNGTVISENPQIRSINDRIGSVQVPANSTDDIRVELTPRFL
ncbi:hypothetical protein A9A89_0955 [Bifidobacterium psychraerophilum DSM 22366]|nr:hypothetical protein A9A89_0955 [Bifidobacterium psychraerophilum DSM 22366]